MPRLTERERRKVCGILYVYASKHPQEVEGLKRIAKKMRCLEVA